MTRICTDKLKSIDIRQLAREGHLNPQRMSWHSWYRWGELSATLHTSMLSDGLWVEWRARQSEGKWHTFTRLLTLERTECHLGGQRTWWRCPNCHKRVALLYGGLELACRSCWGANYRSQRETLEDRSARRLDKVKKRLGWPMGALNNTGGRPKGMHWSTYMRLMREHNARLEVTLEYLGHSLDRISGKLNRIRQLDRL
jgi:hypothetical protein